MVTQKDSIEGETQDTSMSPDKPTSAPAHPNRGILWLVVGHIAVGLMGAYIAYLAGQGQSLSGAAFIGLVFSQTSLVGIWGGLGTNAWWTRLIGVVVGVGYLFPLLGIGIHEVNSMTFILVTMATSFVVMPLLIFRFFRVVIHLDSSPIAPAGRIQFSIRHLMIFTSVIACLISIGKLMQPHLPPGDVGFYIFLIALTCGVVAVLPVWFVLATKRPIIFSIGSVAVGACAGYCLGRAFFDDEEIWVTATATEAVAMVVSLLVVRSCGYRLMRLPPRRPQENLT